MLPPTVEHNYVRLVYISLKKKRGQKLCGYLFNEETEEYFLVEYVHNRNIMHVLKYNNLDKYVT